MVVRGDVAEGWSNLAQVPAKRTRNSTNPLVLWIVHEGEEIALKNFYTKFFLTSNTLSIPIIIRFHEMQRNIEIHEKSHMNKIMHAENMKNI